VHWHSALSRSGAERCMAGRRGGRPGVGLQGPGGHRCPAASCGCHTAGGAQGCAASEWWPARPPLVAGSGHRFQVVKPGSGRSAAYTCPRSPVRCCEWLVCCNELSMCIISLCHHHGVCRLVEWREGGCPRLVAPPCSCTGGGRCGGSSASLEAAPARACPASAAAAAAAAAAAVAAHTLAPLLLLHRR
jgi:hypothetical protein